MPASIPASARLPSHRSWWVRQGQPTNFRAPFSKRACWPPASPSRRCPMEKRACAPSLRPRTPEKSWIGLSRLFKGPARSSGFWNRCKTVPLTQRVECGSVILHRRTVPMRRVFFYAALFGATLLWAQPPRERNYDKPPALVRKVEPVYSDEARLARFEGRALLEAVIDVTGAPTAIKVLSPVGMGLDQKAIECVQMWQFKPGLKNGSPVPVTVSIEVNFRMDNSRVSGAEFNKIEEMRT